LNKTLDDIEKDDSFKRVSFQWFSFDVSKASSAH